MTGSATHVVQLSTAIVGYVSLGLAAGYALLVLAAVISWYLRGASPKSPRMSPVTVLKPLCGAEPGLYENLRSFCLQTYPEFQIVFGVRDAADPALHVVKRLAAEFPSLSIDFVASPELHGSNYKVSNLINMIAQARYDVLVMADSDVCVGADYLNAVTAPLLDQGVGLVTCICRGVPTGRIWSRLGAMYVNEWYLPSVLLARLFGHQGYASGQTLCLRRETLQAVGGLHAIANHLAEDHQLGERVRGLGLRIVLSRYLVKGEHHEPALDALSRHELRWMRTIRALRPRSFPWMFLTFTLPMAFFGIAVVSVDAALSIAAWLLFGSTVLARLALHFAHRLRGERSLLSDFWLLPARDLLIIWVWCRSFFTSRITWRGKEFDVDANGVMRRLS
jgi:ceramide glucosyltransferase